MVRAKTKLGKTLIIAEAEWWVWGSLKSESERRSVMSDSLRPHGLCSQWNSLGQNTGVRSLSLLQGIFPIQGSKTGLSHCRRILYQLSHKGSPRILEGLSLLQWIFLTQESNWGLLHCRQILYQPSHQGSPRILEWVAYPFSSGSSWPRNHTRVSWVAGGFFTNWAVREVQVYS